MEVNLESLPPKNVIKGENFGQNSNRLTVELGGVDITGDCTFDLELDPQQITCTALPQYEEDYLLTVYRGNGNSPVRHDEYDLTSVG